MPIGEVLSYRDAMKLFNKDIFDGSIWGMPRRGQKAFNILQKYRKQETVTIPTTIAELKGAEDPIVIKTKSAKEKKAEEDKKKAEEDKKKAEEDKKKVVKKKVVKKVEEKKDDAPIPIEIKKELTQEEDIKLFIDNFIEEGSKISLDYVYTSGVWLNLCMIHFLKKYKQECFIIFKNYENKMFDLHLFGLNQKGNYEQKIITIQDDVLLNIANTIVHCVKKGVEIIVIPLIIPAGYTDKTKTDINVHQNILLYRVKNNTFERFEPHGSSSRFFTDENENTLYNRELDDKLDSAFTERIYGLDKKYNVDINFPKGAKFIRPNILVNARKGFQSIEPQQAEKFLNINEDAYLKRFGGFCLIWSMFYLEICIKYPKMNGTEICNFLLDYIETKGYKAFYDHIVGYTDYAEKIIKEVIQDSNFSIKNYKNLSITDNIKMINIYRQKISKLIDDIEHHTITVNKKGETIKYKKVNYIKGKLAIADEEKEKADKLKEEEDKLKEREERKNKIQEELERQYLVLEKDATVIDFIKQIVEAEDTKNNEKKLETIQALRKYLNEKYNHELKSNHFEKLKENYRNQSKEVLENKTSGNSIKEEMPVREKNGLKENVVVNVEQKDMQPSLEIIEFAQDETWEPEHYKYFELLRNQLGLSKRDLRKRPIPITEMENYNTAIDSYKNQIKQAGDDLTALINSIPPKDFRKRDEAFYKKEKELMGVRQEAQRLLSQYESQKQKMINWKPMRKIVYEFSYDGYKPDEIIAKISQSNMHLYNNLVWIIKERSKMMAEVNKTRGNPIRRVFFDVILTDTEDKTFIKCAWEITRSYKDDDNKNSNSYVYYDTYSYAHYVEEYKIRDGKDEPEKFQSTETVASMKSKAEKEAEEQKKKEELKETGGVRKTTINGHSVTYRGNKVENGTYDDIYYTDKPSFINDATIVEEKKEGYVITTEWKLDSLKPKPGDYNDWKILITINRINRDEKKFYYKIVGFKAGYSKENFKFIPYQDTKERVAKTTVKGGELNIPLNKLSSENEIPAFEVKKAETISTMVGDGKHHFMLNGFKAVANSDKKKDLEKAVYEDIFKINLYAGDMQTQTTLQGMSQQEYNDINPREKQTMKTKGGDKEYYKFKYTSMDFICKWIDKEKGTAQTIGYIEDKYGDTKTKSLKSYAVTIKMKKGKPEDIDKIKADDKDIDVTKLTN